MIDVTLNASQVVRGLAQAKDKIREAALEAILEGAEHVLYESSLIVPHQDGDLDRSGRTVIDVEALIAYVVYDTPYAAVQHEDMALRHDDGRQAKYLEVPMHAEADTVRELIANRIREVLA